MRKRTPPVEDEEQTSAAGTDRQFITSLNRGLEVLLSDNISRWNKIMAVEIGYSIKSRDIGFDLLLLFPDEAMEKIYSRLVIDEEAFC